MLGLFKTTAAFWIEGEKETYLAVAFLEKRPRVTYSFEIKSRNSSRFEVRGSHKKVTEVMEMLAQYFHKLEESERVDSHGAVV